MIQIQPEYKIGSEYLSLAEREGLEFEVLELSMPGVDRSAALQWYKNCGKVRSFHGAFVDMNPVSNDELIAAASKARHDESCATALEIGAENVVFHSSCFPFLRGKYLDVWAGKSAEYYVGLAEKYNVNILIENSFDIDTTPLYELMKRINDRRVGVCLDIGHANYSRSSLDEWVNALGENIRYAHLSDNEGLFDNHMSLGIGTVDVLRASELLSPLGDIPMTLEVGGMENIKKSIDFIKENHLFGR